jgi:hypothetical protein
MKIQFDKKSVVAGSILTVLAGTALGVSISQANAFWGQGKNQEVQEALELGDYNAFQEARKDVVCPMNKEISEEDFSKMQEMHTLRAEGKFEEAQALREELGLPDRGGKGMNGGGKFSENRQTVYDAVETGDYEAWKEAMGDRPGKSGFTEEDFQKLTQAHQLRESGDYESAQSIMNDLGMGMGKGNGGVGQGRNR